MGTGPSTLETLTSRRRAPLAHRCARREHGGQALRRGLDEQEASRRLRHQHRQHVRVLGLCRRTVFGGLRYRVVGRFAGACYAISATRVTTGGYRSRGCVIADYWTAAVGCSEPRAGEPTGSMPARPALFVLCSGWIRVADPVVVVRFDRGDSGRCRRWRRQVDIYLGAESPFRTIFFITSFLCELDTSYQL